MSHARLQCPFTVFFSKLDSQMMDISSFCDYIQLKIFQQTYEKSTQNKLIKSNTLTESNDIKKQRIGALSI